MSISVTGGPLVVLRVLRVIGGRLDVLSYAKV